MKTPLISGIFFLSLYLIFLSCEKNDDTISELSGIWIENTGRIDTIDFDSWNSGNVFIFRRGSELKNEYMLPKYGSGIYSYELDHDTIILRNWESSCMCTQPYYFQMNSFDQTFQIGNFYDTVNVSGYLFTFIRIK